MHGESGFHACRPRFSFTCSTSRARLHLLVLVAGNGNVLGSSRRERVGGHASIVSDVGERAPARSQTKSREYSIHSMRLANRAPITQMNQTQPRSHSCMSVPKPRSTPG